MHVDRMQNGTRQFDDVRALQEMHALADHLFDLCVRAHRALRCYGNDIEDDLEQINRLASMVNSMDYEASTAISVGRLEELRDYLEAMVLAIEVARVAAVSERRPTVRGRFRRVGPKTMAPRLREEPLRVIRGGQDRPIVREPSTFRRLH